MADGVYVLIPASEYAEMESKIERLEKALDKACSELCILSDYHETLKGIFGKEGWKEWCMKND